MNQLEVCSMYNLFGCRNPSGAAFLKLVNKRYCITWGRQPCSENAVNHVFCDLSSVMITDEIPGLSGVVISFAPIWLFVKFLELMSKESPHKMLNIKGIIACSSSSHITKKYAFNKKDKELASSLSTSHKLLSSVCEQLNIPHQILAPTMVYGFVSGYQDKNISQILRLLRHSPCLVLPQNTGNRQPIHASQLAKVAFKQATLMNDSNWPSGAQSVLNIGGDEIISYKEMVYRLKSNLRREKLEYNCKIIEIPESLYDLLSSFVLPFNPKLFEALMRVKANLSDFTKAHTIIGGSPKLFPVTPFTNS